MAKQYILSIIALIGFSAYGQQCDHIFDSKRTSVGIVVASEITGDISTIAAIPVISMLSPDGETLWRTESTTGYLNIAYMRISHVDASHVYVKVLINETHQNSEGITQIWKLDINNGDIIWKSALYMSDDDQNSDIQDYDDNTFLFYYGIRDNSGGSMSGYRIFMMNKSDASVIQIREHLAPMATFKPILDQNKNLIIGYRASGSENTALIRKLNGLDFDSIVWEKSYAVVSWSIPSLDDISLMIVNKYNDFYVIGSGDIFKINVENGAVIWSSIGQFNDHSISDYQFFGNHFYVSMRHANVGSVYTAFIVKKIDTATGETLWTSTGQMTPDGNLQSTSKNQAVISFDMDCVGDIYATGYYASANYSPGAWGIMKISGQSGEKISDITISNNPGTLNNKSVGVSAYVYNGEPVFLGNLQYSADSSTRVLVKTNADLSSVELKEYPCMIDSDGDSIADWDEDVNGQDWFYTDNTDGEGQPNYLDDDDDNDGVPTINEDANGDGNPLNDFSDPLNPTLPDYLNPNITLGIDEDTLVFSLYPNPTKGMINITHNGALSMQLKLYGLTGTEILSCTENCNVIDMTGIAAGVYFLKLSNGERTTTKKIIKQ